MNPTSLVCSILSIGRKQGDYHAEVKRSNVLRIQPCVLSPSRKHGPTYDSLSGLQQFTPRLSCKTSPYNSIVHLCQQTRNDLHLFLSILVLLAFDLGSLCATLLLRLASFHPLFHGQVLTKLSQIVVLQAEAVEERAVGDGV